MFPFAHLYCTKKITNSSLPDLLYGSIFQDIPMTGIVSWDKMKIETENFSKVIKQKYPELEGFAVGLLLHEEPMGIDRFVHGGGGYAYLKGAEIIGEIEKYFPDRSIHIAHSFIEFAVEMLLIEKLPDAQDDAKELLIWETGKHKQLTMAFGEFFDLRQPEASSAILEFNDWLLRVDLSSREKGIAFYTKLTNKMRHTDYSEEIVGNLLEKAVAVVKEDYMNFLEETIAKCKNG